MTTDRALTLAAFDDIITQLRITDDGLDGELNTLGGVEITARLCADVKKLTEDADTPADLLIHRLACLTEELLTTVVLAGGPQIVRDWLKARAELTELRLRGI